MCKSPRILQPYNYRAAIKLRLILLYLPKVDGISFINSNRLLPAHIVLHTQSHTAVLQQIAQVVEHGLLVLTANPTEVAQKAAAAGHHLREGDLLQGGMNFTSAHIICSHLK